MFQEDDDIRSDHQAGGAGGFRAGRGMMEPAILGALAERPMHGYQVISYLSAQSHNVWRPSPGSVYPMLQMLEEKGDATACEVDGKKVYTLTDSGRAAASAAGDLRAGWGQRLLDMHDYHRQFHSHTSSLFKLMRQIFRKGTPNQKTAMEAAILDFKARLAQILAEE